MATATAGQKARASQINSLPYTVTLGGQDMQNNSANVTTTETVVMTTPTFTLVANTWYAVDFDLLYTSTIGGDVLIARIRETNLAGTSRQAFIPFAVVQNNGGPYSVRGTYNFQTGANPSPLNWVGTIIRSSGSGNCQALIGSRLMVNQLPASAVVTTV